MKLSFSLITTILFIGLIGIAVYWLSLQANPPFFLAKAENIQTYRPLFKLPDLNGTVRSNTEWDGKIVIVNFWATWCPPCAAEIPDFNYLQEKYGKKGLQFLGIAIDDEEAVKVFVEQLKIKYPILLGDGEEGINIAEKFGNEYGGLPYTVIIDKEKRILWQHLGELNKEELENIIAPLLQD